MEKIVLRTNSLWLEESLDKVYLLKGDIENVVFRYNDGGDIISLEFKDLFTIERESFLIADKKLKLSKIYNEGGAICLKFDELEKGS